MYILSILLAFLLLFYYLTPLSRESRHTIHVNMLLIVDILLVEVVDLDLLLAVTRAQQLQEVLLELVAVLVDVLLGVLANQEHLPHLR